MMTPAVAYFHSATSSARQGINLDRYTLATG